MCFLDCVASVRKRRLFLFLSAGLHTGLSVCVCVCVFLFVLLVHHINFQYIGLNLGKTILSLLLIRFGLVNIRLIIVSLKL